MITGLIPMRYAKALYKYAEESGSCQAVYDEMKVLIKSFQANEDLSKVLANPYVKAEDKKKLLEAAVGKTPTEPYRRFVKLILEHRREEMAYLMALSYRDYYRKENKISQVRIKTAVEMSDAELAKLRSVVEKSFTDTTFEYEYEIDADIIGGFIIDVDSVRMDASLSGELEQLRQNLLRSN